VNEKKASNVMRDIRVAKLILNCCTGESGDRLQKAAKVRSRRQQWRRQLAVAYCAVVDLVGHRQCFTGLVPWCAGLVM
jgi:hypothetical protein